MALLFMDSFDHYATADLLEKWSLSSLAGTGATLTIDATNGRRSSGSLRWVTGTSSTGQGGVQKTLVASGATAIMGFGFRINSAAAISAGGMVIAGFRDSGTTQVHLRVKQDLTLEVFRSTGTSIAGPTSVGLSVGTYYYIEWKVVISDTVGTVDVRINGVNRLSATGLDTKQTSSATWGTTFLGNVEGTTSLSGTTTQVDFDDVYVLDGSGAAPWNDFLGDVRVDVRNPTGAGATTQFTPSAGSNWQNVDDAAPNDDTDYNSSSTTGHTDTFVVQDAPVAGATIYGIQHCLSMKKMDAGTCTVAPVIRHSGVDYPGADLSPGTSYAYGLQIAQTNPGTGAAWTEAGFNAIEVGYKKTA